MSDNHYHLFPLIAEGDDAAFNKAFYIYSPVIYAYLLGLTKNPATTHDLVQEVFFTLWLKRSDLPGVKNPVGWLHGIAYKLALNEFRSRRTRHNFLSFYKKLPVLSDVNEQLNRKQLLIILENGIAALTEHRRDILLLSWRKNLSRSQIAGLLNISPHTVKNQLAASIRFLQEYINTHTGIYLPASLLLYCWDFLQVTV